ncbi:MAG: chemotaxis protein CheD [Candidatus Omnitrophota bacterium]
MAGSLKDVQTGEVAVGARGDILRSSAIGSCVVVSLYSPREQVGGQAHIMLPGRSLKDDNPLKLRYCLDAVDAVLGLMALSGSLPQELEACLVGAGNVLKRPEDTTASNNLAAVESILTEKGIMVRARSVGGMERRSVRFDIARACVFFYCGRRA